MSDGPLQVDARDAFNRPVKIAMYPDQDDPTDIVVATYPDRADTVDAPVAAFKIQVTPRARLDEFQDALNIAAEIARRRQGL